MLLICFNQPSYTKSLDRMLTYHTIFPTYLHATVPSANQCVSVLGQRPCHCLASSVWTSCTHTYTLDSSGFTFASLSNTFFLFLLFSSSLYSRLYFLFSSTSVCVTVCFTLFSLSSLEHLCFNNFPVNNSYWSVTHVPLWILFGQVKEESFTFTMRQWIYVFTDCLFNSNPYFMALPPTQRSICILQQFKNYRQFTMPARHYSLRLT